MVDEHRICGRRDPAAAALHVHATAVGGTENGRHRFARRPVSGRGGEDSANSAAVVEKRPRGGVPGVARRGYWFWHRKSGVMAMAGSGGSRPLTGAGCCRRLQRPFQTSRQSERINYIGG